MSGKVRIFKEQVLPGGGYERHPSEIREEFSKKGWKNVLGTGRAVDDGI